jgi:mRNA-degrading endonuclease RelE of RelBE toxin-antitoxin system
MSGENENKIAVFETPTFKKVFKKLSNKYKDLVDDEIDLIIKNPEIGEQKKGDLSHLWVHKFILNNKQVLLGYSWKEEKLELWLLNLAPHENFYTKAQK